MASVTSTSSDAGSSCWHTLFRIKTSTRIYLRDTPLYHTVFDLINASLAAILPVGAFILVGQVAKDCAGPSVTLSVLLAAVSAFLTGQCYSELRSRCHRGQTTAYEYIYRVGGELPAFVAGWTLLLHHVACIATTARSISTNIDCLSAFTLSNLTLTNVGQLPVLQANLDFVAFFIVLVSMLLVAVNILWPLHRKLNIILNASTVAVLVFAMLLAVHRLNFKNWATPTLFFTNSANGVFAGAAILVYAFSTYETTFRSTDFTSRVVRRPVLLAEGLNFALTTLLLIGVGSCMTLISLSTTWQSEAPLAESYLNAGIVWMKYFLSVFAILFLLPVQLHQFHSSVLMLRDLSVDGLLPKALSSQPDDHSTPLWAAAACGVLSAPLAMLFSLTSLTQLLAISFILVHTTAALIVLALRFRPTEESAHEAQRRRQIQRRLRRRTQPRTHGNNNEPNKSIYGSMVPPVTSPSAELPTDSSNPSSSNSLVDDVELLGQTENLTREDHSSSDSDIDDVVEEYKYNVCIRVLSEQRHRDFLLRTPTVESYRRALLGILGFLISSMCVAAILLHGQHHLLQPVVLVFLVLFLLTLLVSLGLAVRQPIDTVECAFLLIKVPLVPWVPLAAALVNIHLMVALPAIPWITLAVWSITGLVIYSAYGVRNSNEARVQEHAPGEQRGLLPYLPSSRSVTAKMLPTRGYRQFTNETSEATFAEERA